MYGPESLVVLQVDIHTSFEKMLDAFLVPPSSDSHQYRGATDKSRVDVKPSVEKKHDCLFIALVAGNPGEGVFFQFSPVIQKKGHQVQVSKSEQHTIEV